MGGLDLCIFQCRSLETGWWRKKTAVVVVVVVVVAKMLRDLVRNSFLVYFFLDKFLYVLLYGLDCDLGPVPEML